MSLCLCRFMEIKSFEQIKRQSLPVAAEGTFFIMQIVHSPKREKKKFAEFSWTRNASEIIGSARIVKPKLELRNFSLFTIGNMTPGLKNCWVNTTSRCINEGELFGALTFYLQTFRCLFEGEWMFISKLMSNSRKKHNRGRKHSHCLPREDSSLHLISPSRMFFLVRKTNTQISSACADIKLHDSLEIHAAQNNGWKVFFPRGK